MKPRKRISPISIRQRMKLGLYGIKKLEFMQAHQWCQCCKVRYGMGHKPKKAQEIHHQRGRNAGLLLDERFWLAICRPCHFWIHDHIAEARKLGLIAEAGKWNNPRE